MSSCCFVNPKLFSRFCKIQFFGYHYSADFVLFSNYSCYEMTISNVNVHTTPRFLWYAGALKCIVFSFSYNLCQPSVRMVQEVCCFVHLSSACSNNLGDLGSLRHSSMNKHARNVSRSSQLVQDAWFCTYGPLLGNTEARMGISFTKAVSEFGYTLHSFKMFEASDRINKYSSFDGTRSISCEGRADFQAT